MKIGLQPAANDSYHLKRFVDAQVNCFKQVQAELSSGQKQSHWMWFIFPQIKGLGSSGMAERFAISGLDEARAYILHPLLGSRLRDCTELVNSIQGRGIDEIFGYPDDLKFHSSITLFSAASASSGTSSLVFSEAMTKYFDGKADPATLDRI